jgi:hypothetical protein
MKGYPSKKLFIIHVKGKKYQLNKKWSRLGVLKVRPKFGHSKVHNYLYHILNPYKQNKNEIITKNAFEC